MRFIERENEILKIIDKLSDEKLKFIVVGGYAVSALARHRFSVDLDIITRKKDINKFKKILEKEGYKIDIAKVGFDKVYSGEFLSYKKSINNLPLTVDLLVGSVVCRATNASWSFKHVNRYSVISTISGIESFARARVPEKELLTALKIHSGRRTDLRDVVLLMENADIARIIIHLRRGDLNILKKQIKRLIEMLKDEKLVNSLKGVFSISFDVNKQIENSKEKLEEIFHKI